MSFISDILESPGAPLEQTTNITDFPLHFELRQNFPNPFNGNTTFEFVLPKSVHVVLKIYNQLGQIIILLANRVLSAGVHRIVWDGKDANGNEVSTGMYYYSLSADKGTLLRSMLKR